MEELFYLKGGVLAEPLVDQWYAQPLLIPPATAALLTANIHLPIMRSYIADPGSHEAALEWPEMHGGGFIDYPARQVEAIQSLLEQTVNRRQNSILLADAIKNIAPLLEKTTGHSLSPLYKEVPEALRGYIELGYDLMNRAYFKIFESLFYQSEYSLEEGQIVELSEPLTDSRPFCLSTPRLFNKDTFAIKLPFKSMWYDDCFSSREYPISEKKIRSLHEGIPNKHEAPFEKFLTFFSSESRPASEKKLSRDEIRIRYFGHACLLFETSKVSILTDVSMGYSFPNCGPRYSHKDLPDKIDFLLITHAHQDHIQIEHLLQLRYKIDTVVVPVTNSGSLQDPSLKLLFESLGFKKVIAIDDMQKIPIPGGSITGIPFIGEHGDIDIKGKIAYAIHLNNFSALCLADANAVELAIYKKVRRIIGKIDAVFLSMECEGAPVSWLYNAFQLKPFSRSQDNSRRLDASNSERAIEIIRLFQCSEVYIYGMGQEPWLSHIMNLSLEPTAKQQLEMNKLKEYCKEQKILFECLFEKKEIAKL